MTDKITKFLAKLSVKELESIQEAVGQISSGRLTGLNAKAIKGKKGFIRVRVSRIRIIAKQTDAGYEIIHITNRNEKTYNLLQN